MTRAEILDCLTDRPCDVCRFHESGRCERWDCVFEEKPDDVEPCEDAISRQAALDAFNLSEKTRKYGGDHSGYDTMMLYEIQDVIEDLPSVTPKQKVGHWIMPVQDDGMSDPIYYQVRCSECGFDLDPQTWHMELHQYGADKYCPNCGAKMQEVDE